MHSALLSSVLLLGAALPAQQSAVVPSHFAFTEGDTSSSTGIGANITPSRLLMVMDQLKGTPRLISAVTFRLDGLVSATYPGSTLLANIDVSDAATTAASPSPTFDNNHGANRTRVQSNSTQINWSATGTMCPAGPFVLKLPFAMWNFGGQSPLCIDIQVTSRNNQSPYALDFASGTNPDPGLLVQNVGIGCTATTAPVTLGFTGGSNWPAGLLNLSYSGANLPTLSSVSLLFGTNKQSFGPVMLPFQLPGTAMDPSGACTFYSDVVAGVPALSDSSGFMTVNMPNLPLYPGLNGFDLYTQVLAPAPGANRYGAVLSDGAWLHFVAPWGQLGVGTVDTNGTLGPTGTVSPLAGYVVEIS